MSSVPVSVSDRMFVALDCLTRQLPFPLKNCEGTYPRIRARSHARQERRLVRQIPHSQRLQSAHAHVPTERTSSSTTSSSISQHLSVDSRKSQRRNVGNDDERSREDALVACFGALDDFGTQNHVEPGSEVSEDAE